MVLVLWLLLVLVRMVAVAAVVCRLARCWLSGRQLYSAVDDCCVEDSSCGTTSE